MLGYLANTGGLGRVGVGWVPAAAVGPTLLPLTWWGKPPPAAQTKAMHFLPMVGEWVLEGMRVSASHQRRC